ncbi:hypothetical protein Droror1_Dr00006388 [Drosera rotundifolia]
MGVVSFKISRTGSRFTSKPKSLPFSDSAVEPGSAVSGAVDEPPATASSAPKLDWRDEDTGGISGLSLSSKGHNLPSEAEVSFILNLYQDGFSITKPKENENGNHLLQQDDSKLLFPYDRSSESLLSAIESGHLPGDLLDDIPCNYIDGGVICEVRDYRKCSPEVGSGVHSLHPITTKLHLKMSLENLVKDIPLIADDSWTYGDLMEVESRILKVLQPKLILDPTPRLDRLSDSGASWKLDFDLRGMKKKRLRQLSETVVTTTNKLSSKRICVDRVPETSGYRMGEPGSVSGDVTLQRVHERTMAQDVISNDLLTSRSRNFMQEGLPSNLALQQSKLHVAVGAGNQIIVQDPLTGVNSTSGCNASVLDVLSYNNNLNSTGLHGKMETQDGQLRQVSNTNKRAVVGGDGAQQRSEYIDNLQQGPDMQWRNSLLQQQANARVIQYASNGGQRQSHLVREGIPGQDIATSVAIGQHGLRSSANGENNGMAFDISEVGRIKNDMTMLESEGMDRLQQRIQPNSLVRPGFTPGWNNLSQQVEKKEEQLQKRKTVRSPRVSAGSLSQSPLSARPTEMPGVLFNNYAAIPSASPPVLSQREKSGVTSMASVPRAQSVTSSANDTMQQQHQVQTTGKRRSNSLPKTSAMSGVGSPASVSNASIPMNAASPSVGTPQQADHIVLDKFSKIEMVTMRHQLNRRKTKVDELSRKPHIFFPQHVSTCLSSLETNENIEDDSVKSLSKSVVGGSANSYKIRVLSFVQAEHTSQAPVISRGRTRMIMSEKPNEGTIAMHYGDVDNDDYLRAEDYLPTLPNSHSADLLAAQFQVLMIRDGYIMECDIIQTRPPNVASNSQPSAPATPSTNSAADTQQFSEAVSGQQQSEVIEIIQLWVSNLAANSSRESPTKCHNVTSWKPTCPSDFSRLIGQWFSSSRTTAPGLSSSSTAAIAFSESTLACTATPTYPEICHDAASSTFAVEYLWAEPELAGREQPNDGQTSNSTTAAAITHAAASDAEEDDDGRCGTRHWEWFGWPGRPEWCSGYRGR